MGVYGLDLGAITPFLHTFRERERGPRPARPHLGRAAPLPLRAHRRREARPLAASGSTSCDAFLDAGRAAAARVQHPAAGQPHLPASAPCGVGVIDRETRDPLGRDGAGAARRGRRLRRAPRRALLRSTTASSSTCPSAPAGSPASPGDCFHRHWVRVRRSRSRSRSCARRCARCRRARSQGQACPKGLKPPKGEVYVRGREPARRARRTTWSREGEDKAVARALPRAVVQQHRRRSPRSRRARCIADLVALIGQHGHRARRGRPLMQEWLDQLVAAAALLAELPRGLVYTIGHRRSRARWCCSS